MTAPGPVPAAVMASGAEFWLIVAECFGIETPTFQGEGPSCGHPALFIRLSRCNLTCVSCDTKYTWDWAQFDPRKESVKRSVADLVAWATSSPVELVVITGGEPLIQQRRLIPLVHGLLAAGKRVEFETNGTLVPDRALLVGRVRFNVSPKARQLRGGRGQEHRARRIGGVRLVWQGGIQVRRLLGSRSRPDRRAGWRARARAGVGDAGRHHRGGGQRDDPRARGRRRGPPLAGDTFRLCAVLHAADDEEWLHTYDALVTGGYAGAIALPASRRPDPDRQLCRTRWAATAYLEERGMVEDRIVYRLLGLGRTGHLELVEQREHEWISSVDGAAPVILGAMGIALLPEGPYEKPPTPRIEQLGPIPEDRFGLIRQNIAVVRAAAGSSVQITEARR